MKVTGDGNLKGDRSLSRFSMEICIISGHFFGTLTEIGHIQLVGIQTLLQNSHKGKWRWTPRGAC